MKKSDLFFNVLRLPVDFLMLMSAGVATYLLRTEILSSFRPVLFEFNLPLLEYFYLVIFVSLLFLGAYAVSGLYSIKPGFGIGEEFLKIIIAASAGIMAIIVYIFLRQELFNSRFLVLGGLFMAIVFTFAGRMFIRWLQNYTLAKYNFGIHKLIILGSGEIAEKIKEEVSGDPLSGYKIVKQISGLPGDSETWFSILDSGADEVILVENNFKAEETDFIIRLCQEKHIAFKFIPSISGLLGSNLETQIFKGFALVEIKRTNLDGWGKVIKRVSDILLSSFGLMILSPLFALVAFSIKWETEGPVFVRLKRVSGNKEFYLYKFRSMVKNAEELKQHLLSYNERNDGPLFKIKNDPRITKVGRVIRKTRIDEAPQLWNILKGDISLIGPRPHQPDEIAQYQKHHKKVLAIKAGATGLAQVSGSSDLNFEKEVILDSYYIDNWSLWLDIKILFKTLLKILVDKSAV